MAVKTFTAGITRQNDLDTTASIGTIGGGPGGSILSALRYQGTGAVARRINSTNTAHGFTITEGTTRDTTAAAFRAFSFKGFLANVGDLNPNGMQLRLGSTTNAYHVWIMGDDGTIVTPGYQYPLKGGFIVKVVDATLRAWVNSTTGSPAETAVDVYALTGDITTTSNGENLALDSLDWIETGFHAVGGTSTDPQIEFFDFVDQDEGAANASFDRAGLWQSSDGIYNFVGRHTVGRTAAGTVTASEFFDQFSTVVCRGDYVREGFNALEFDIGNASTTVEMDNITIIGAGRTGRIRRFDARSTTAAPFDGDVNTTLDEITNVGHGFITGEQLEYFTFLSFTDVVSPTGGESEFVTGTTGPFYYAINVDDDTFAVATSFANALAGTRAPLTAATGSAQIAKFHRTPDTRYDFIQTGTAGTLDISACSFISARELTFDTNATITGSQFVGCNKLTAGDATFDGCTFNSPTVVFNDSFFYTDDPGLISNCTFISGPDGGHAIRISTPGTYTFDGNDFQNYGADGTQAAAIFNDSAGLVTLNVQNAPTTPTVRTGNLATTVVNNTVTVSVRAVDTDVANVVSARVWLVAAAGGDLAVDTVILDGDTNAGGTLENTGFNFTNPQPVTGRVRKSSASPYYKTSNITGTITDAGFSTVVVMVLDE